MNEPSAEFSGRPLSSDERRIGRETDYESRSWKRKQAARSILREALYDTTWAELLADPTRGEIAAKLYGTWDATDRSDALVETVYSVTALYEDLGAAMRAHGLSTFDHRCAGLGRRTAETAIDYILSAHAADAEAAEADIRAAKTQHAKDSAR